jgi:hypothetical protein
MGPSTGASRDLGSGKHTNVEPLFAAAGNVGRREPEALFAVGAKISFGVDGFGYRPRRYDACGVRY